MKYIALLDYQSTLGAFAAGDTVELSESVARAINRDQPRTLTLSIEPLEPQGEGNEDSTESAAEAGIEEVETREMPAPPQDRMVRRAPRNRAK